MLRSRIAILGLLATSALITAACSRTFVVVPRPSGGYTRIDTLRGRANGRDVLVRFHHDTTWRVDTVFQVRTDTLYRGVRTIVRVDTLVRFDTIRIGSGTTTRPVPPRRDSVATLNPRRVTDVEPTRPRVDTIRLTRVDTIRIARVDTIRIARVDTIRIATGAGRVDTVRVVRVDTLRLTGAGRIDTVRVVSVDTVRVAGQRVLFVPPGQMPPEGQCRLWIPNRPPGQQANAAPCASLGNIPTGAFILFGGEAYDADYDWVTESRRSRVPAQIVALSRRGNRP
jgi:hypothetical protein